MRSGAGAGAGGPMLLSAYNQSCRDHGTPSNS